MAQIDSNHKIHFTHKGRGNSSDIEKLIFHHLDKHGMIESDNQHSKGAKHFWINLIKRNPNLKYTIHHNGNEYYLNPHKIDDHESKIWSKDNKDYHKTIRVRK